MATSRSRSDSPHGVALERDPAVTQHGHAVTDVEDILEEMADIEDGGAADRHPPQIVVQRPPLAGVEAGGGLVQNDDARAKIAGADDGRHLPAMQPDMAE